MAGAEAWVAAAAKQKLIRQQIDLGPLAAEDVEVAVDHCGLCHSDYSVLNDPDEPDQRSVRAAGGRQSSLSHCARCRF